MSEDQTLEDPILEEMPEEETPELNPKPEEEKEKVELRYGIPKKKK
jgi:hypothetical protein